MNVLIYCLSSVSGGAIAYLRSVVPLLADEFERSNGEHTLKFLAHEEQAECFAGIDEGLIHWVRGPRPVGYRRLLWERINLSRIARAVRADVLFTPYQIGPRVQGARQVLMIRNMEPFLFGAYRYSFRSWLRNRILGGASAACLRRADRVVAVSGFARDYLIGNLSIGGENIRTIHHGSPPRRPDGNRVRDEELLRKIGIEGDYLLTCGSLLPYRRCEDVISAFGRASPHLAANLGLVIAGSGSDQRYGELIRRAIASSPLREQIRAVGHVPWETMAALYRCSAAVIIATEIEACPNIAIEAMTAGCVIVSSDRPPLPEMFAGCSLTYRARDIDDLVEKLRQGLESEQSSNQIRGLALARAEHFSWARCASETYAALTQWP